MTNRQGIFSAIGTTLSGVALLLAFGTLPTCGHYQRADVAEAVHAGIHADLHRIESTVNDIRQLLLKEFAGDRRGRR